MSDTVKNISDILVQLEKALREDTKTKSMRISRMGQVNTDPALARDGWVGLYVDAVNYQPRTLGSGFQNWEFKAAFMVIVQASDQANSGNAHVRLETYIKSVMDVILSDVTLNNYVDVLDDMQISYATDENDVSTLHFEGAIISLQFSGRTN